MPFDPEAHHRRSIRLSDANYGMGCYFVTICTVQKLPLFGEINGKTCVLSCIGEIAQDCWLQIPRHMPHVQIDAYIVMPNHLHGILSIGQDLSRYETRQFGSSQAGQLSSVIAAYKAAVTRSVNREVKEPGGKIWQRGYYEKIVRTKDAYEHIHAYIYENPEQWAEDEENPARRLP